MPLMETKNPSKILVVDDDPRLRDLLRRYLGEQGFNVYVAENATAMNKLWNSGCASASTCSCST